MDGLTAVKRYMQDVPDRGRVVFIAVTASISEDMREECLRAGMLGYIVKPVNLQDLDTLIRRHLK